MAHDVQLRYRDHVAEVTAHPDPPKEGLAAAEILVHYNFDPNYAKVGEWRVRDLHGKTGNETIVTLAKIIERLGIDTADDLTASTDGNAGRVAYYLLRWAIEHPEAVWRVS
jgi:hypothetical protein